MTSKIFIDGAAGTTGLVISGLLQPLIEAGKISLISIADRKDETQRRAAYAEADLTVLCLPDNEARKAMEMIKGTKTRVLDASSAHRTEDGWVYGLPELTSEQPDLIRKAQHVSNPGCFATGAVALLRPLIDAGMLDKNECVTLLGVSGYSAGGKKTIVRHENAGEEDRLTNAFSAAALNAPHKHTAEIQKYAGLQRPPLFLPHVIDVPRGMMVTAVFNRAALKGGTQEVREIYKAAYALPSTVRIEPQDNAQRFDFSRFAGLNAKNSAAPPIETLDIRVDGFEDAAGKEGQVRVTAFLDNLGKGAGTQAVQNIKLMLGL